MIALDSLHTIRMGRPTPGAVDHTPNVAPRVAINLGLTLNLWFSDPADLAELEDAARTQRLRLEAILGHIPVDGDRAPARLPNVGAMPSMPPAPDLTGTATPADLPMGHTSTAMLLSGVVAVPAVGGPQRTGEPERPTSQPGDHGLQHSDPGRPRPGQP